MPERTKKAELIERLDAAHNAKGTTAKHRRHVRGMLMERVAEFDAMPLSEHDRVLAAVDQAAEEDGVKLCEKERQRLALLARLSMILEG